MKIKYFDLKKQLPKYAVVVLLGRRRSGKTVNIFSLLQERKDAYDFGLCFCGSAATREQFREIMPNEFVYDGIDIDKLKNLVKMQEEDVEKGIAKSCLLIIDDCGFQSKLFNTDVFRKIAMNGRHYKLFVIISLQYSLGIKPALRNQVDIVVASMEKNVANKKRIFEHYSVCFRKFRDFELIFDQCTKNFESCIIAVAARSSNIDENIFFWKSQFPIPSFKLNEKGMWWGEYLKKNTNSEREEKRIKRTRNYYSKSNFF